MRTYNIDFMDVTGDEPINIQVCRPPRTRHFATVEITAGDTAIRFYGGKSDETGSAFAPDTQLQVSLASLAVLFERVVEEIRKAQNDHLDKMILTRS